MSNLYTGDIEVVKKEILKLREYLVTAKTVSEQHMCISQIFGLNDFYKTIVGHDYINFDKMINFNKYRLNQVNSFGYKHQDRFSDNFILNKEKIFNDSSFISQLMGKKYSDSEEFFLVMKFDEKLAMEIIFDFLKKYHPEDISYLNKLIKEKRLINLNETDSSLKGYCSYIYKSLPLIFVQSPMYTIETLSFLIHEFGHGVDMKNLTTMYSPNQIQKMFLSSGDDEVLAKLYEREILSFFIEEGINREFAVSLLSDYYSLVMDSLLEVQFFSCLPDWLLYKSEYLKYRSKEILDLVANEEVKSKFRDSKLDFENIDIFSSVRYSVGGLNAFLLHSRLKNDSSSVQKNFRHFVGNRVSLFDGNLINYSNFSLEELEKVLYNECETIKKYKK